ncbi:hypothetical protein KUTeg_024502 [Tegillarca granosa]|uniref:2-oxo-4-hydroxy-4-carboxy-5-ureidoimidazoline decarboxylase n=1 Tax=Tegillarca granosa TaxID=220873 RepID=A0ABQ9E2L9_TEGGR|nr:hypothetical protein KUTeg_024502 [Tegillarca granosa]
MMRLMPDLAGRLAKTGALSKESTKEQASAGLNTMSPKERLKLQNKKEAIFQGLEERLNNSMEQETLTGVDEVKKICYLRLLDIVDENSKL